MYLVTNLQVVCEILFVYFICHHVHHTVGDYFYTQGDYETHHQVKFRTGSDNAFKPHNLHDEIDKVSKALTGKNKITLVFVCLEVAKGITDSAYAIPVVC